MASTVQRSLQTWRAHVAESSPNKRYGLKGNSCNKRYDLFLSYLYLMIITVTAALPVQYNQAEEKVLNMEKIPGNTKKNKNKIK